MPRIKRAVHARKKRRKVLEQAKGYVGQPHVSYRKAKDSGSIRRPRLPRPQEEEASLPPALDRPDQRRGAREGLSYNQFVAGCRKAEIELDRKVLADLAVQ